MSQTDNPEMNFPRGLEGVIAAATKISFIDGQKGLLLYRGVPIEEIVEKSFFEEVMYFMLYDKWPTQQELDGLIKKLKDNMEIPDRLIEIIRDFPKTTHSMDILRTAFSYLGGLDPEEDTQTPEANYEKAIKITAKMPTIISAWSRIRRGLEPIKPDPELSYPANFLYMLKGEKPNEEETRIMDVALMLHIEHGMNASTFSAMVTISTLSDLYSAIVSAIGTLKGPIHGGANERALKMLKEIGSPDKARDYVINALEKKIKIMGFGHRVYKSYDPRARILKEYAEKLSQERGDTTYIEIAKVIEETMIEKVGKKGIFPNVDFYSGIVYQFLGIPVEDYTPIFAMARSVGWSAHAIEYLENNRIFRPRALYIGPKERHYVPMEERK